MLSAEILQQIKEIEIHTRRAIAGTHVGRRVSRKSGSGFEFDQIRAYQPGDDIRFIDWKNLAKTGTLQVRQYVEERNRTFMICVDISSSLLFSSTKELQHVLVQKIASVLTLVALAGDDKVGVIFFSDTVEKVIPAGKGRAHARYILEQIFQVSFQDKKTNMAVAFEYMLQHKLNLTGCFIISDGIDPWTNPLIAVAGVRYECILIRCLDHYEQKLPEVGMWMQDLETKEYFMYVPGLRTNEVNRLLEKRVVEQNKQCKKAGIYLLTLHSDSDFIGSIIHFFRIKMMY